MVKWTWKLASKKAVLGLKTMDMHIAIVELSNDYQFWTSRLICNVHEYFDVMRHIIL